ncbi:MAG TPA: NAD(P)-dependent alcohol dehydrogenase [Gemmatimonas sp.]|nr:NAD(P)-dependent alcohol dehydrogenase [Gemmatimonas sp.]
MTRRTRILGGTVLLFATALLTLGLVLSYDAACPAPLPDETTATATVSAAQSMQAARYRCYGDTGVIAWETVPRPVITDSGVLVRVHAAATNPLDWHYMRGKPYIMRLSSGIGRPSDVRLGTDFAGVVEAVGASVTRFAPGDSVFGASSGTFGRYITVREAGAIARLPHAVSLEQAGVVAVAATTALQAVRDVGLVARGQRVLVNGASGGVGTYAVQIAKAMGAHVTGVSSTRNVEMVQLLGADTVIDYTRDDFTTSEARYDVIIDNVGNHAPSALRRVLTPTGRVVMVGGPDRDRWLGPIRSFLYAAVYGWFTKQSFGTLFANTTSADLAYLATLMSQGQLRSIIDRRFEAPQLREAIAYQEAGRSRGKNVVLIP